jgi:hypothetical protein
MGKKRKYRKRIKDGNTHKVVTQLVTASERQSQVRIKVYKYKVVSIIFNDDIYGIEIIYLQERLHVLVKILAMSSLV